MVNKPRIAEENNLLKIDEDDDDEKERIYGITTKTKTKQKQTTNQTLEMNKYI